VARVLAGRDFVVLSDEWNGLPTSAIHLFRRLSKRNRIFWFNTIGRLPRLSIGDARKVARTAGAWLRRRPSTKNAPCAGEENVNVETPVLVPWFKRPVRWLNRRSLLRKYESICSRFTLREPIFVTTFPYTVDFLNAVHGGPKVYYCVDDFLDYPGVNHRDWAAMEAELVHGIDGLVVTSRTLAAKRSNGCAMLHLPHGVDFDHFHDARRKAMPEPGMESIPRPIIGFFGLISEWVDLEVVRSLSDAFPHCSFVFLGRTEVDMTVLEDRPNVHRLGWVPYADLPRYARYFDVGLIPFRLNQLTRAVNPLKLMEYFALGLPVLATKLPELETIGGPLYLAETPAEFQRQLAQILAIGAGTRVEEALAIARANTWDARVADLSAFIQTLPRAG
jgi:glycosyltransferase involved in cell wall biosynthesis